MGIPWSPVVGIHSSTSGGLGSIPDWGTKISHTEWHQEKKELGANKVQNKNKWEYIKRHKIEKE